MHIPENGTSRLKIWHKFAVMITIVILAYLSITSVIVLKAAEKLGNTIQITFPIVVIISISLTLAAITTSIISVMFLDPIDQINEAMKKVANGDFSVRVNFTRRRRKCPIQNIELMNHNFNKMVDALNSTEMLKSDFITNVSHELKTPLASIEGYASLLSATELTDEQRVYAHNIMQSASRLTTLTGNILRLSKLENDQIAARRTSFSLDEQIRQEILMQEQSWSDKELDIEPELDSVDYTGYQELLQHVWSNLISNAVKFTPNGGSIYFTLHETADNVIASVRDTGIGMSVEEQAHAFDKFYQGDNNHSVEGNGLGLALVKKIVAMHGGSINIKSAPNEGSTFTVTLPKPDLQ